MKLLIELDSYIFKKYFLCWTLYLYIVSENTTVDKLSPKDLAIASALSKVLASTMTYPHEVPAPKFMACGVIYVMLHFFLF